MGKYAAILSAQTVKNLNECGLHFVGGVPNLALHISKSGARSWIFRYPWQGKRRDMGLGPFPEISLAEAREIVLQKRALLRSNIDPIEERRAQRGSAYRKTSKSLSFEKAAKAYIDSHRAGWKNIKHADQWENGFKTFAYPVIGSTACREVTLEMVMKIIEPLWKTKTETASRLRGRIELVLSWAAVHGYRDGDNPARWKGNIELLLPPRSKVAAVKHHAALEWDKCPPFFRSLNDHSGAGARALKFCILTACRTGEVRGAKWSEIDLEKAVWEIPAERMKAAKPHRVPLSPPAIELLRSLPRFVGGDFIFTFSGSSPLSDMSLLKVLRDRGEKFTVHGFRSSFRDWAGETTQFPREVIEHALAHQLKDKAEAAYARGDLFTKRVALMADWAEFLIARQV